MLKFRYFLTFFYFFSGFYHLYKKPLLNFGAKVIVLYPIFHTKYLQGTAHHHKKNTYLKFKSKTQKQQSRMYVCMYVHSFKLGGS